VAWRVWKPVGTRPFATHAANTGVPYKRQRWQDHSVLHSDPALGSKHTKPFRIDLAAAALSEDHDIAAIRPKRVRADDAANRGEMSRAVLGVLREAPGPMAAAAVVAAVMAGRGMDARDRKAAGTMMGRVGMALRR
jgi:hypothetical protein